MSALHVLIGLEGGAGGVMAGGCVGGAHGDLTGGTTGLPVMVSAVLHVADHTLDVAAALLVVHFAYRPFGLPRGYRGVFP